MKPPNDIDDRLIELEIKASFTEDLLDHLNKMVARQQDQIELLARELRRLQRQPAGSDSQPAESLRDELPPHY